MPIHLQYIKVSHTTKVEIIYQLMTKHWNLKTPNLIISVTGGAKNFSLRTRLKEVFRRSLIKASESTGAWITTGGTRTGVMKHVGKAVEQYAAVKDDEKRVGHFRAGVGNIRPASRVRPVKGF